MNLLIDTHCHLNFDVFENDIDAVLGRAKENGIFKIIVPGFDLPSSIKAVELANKFPSIHAAVGIHPNSFDSWKEDSKLELLKLVSNPKVVAIGEVGLDLYRNPNTLRDQERILRIQLELAKNKKLPILLHNRKSSSDLLRIIRDFDLQGIFHAFEGDPALLEFGMKNGFYFGIGGSITYKSSTINKEILELYWKNGVLETDSPFLSPLPFRGQRNEPSRIKQIAEFSATMLDMGIEKIAETTTNNVKALFNWK